MSRHIGGPSFEVRPHFELIANVDIATVEKQLRSGLATSPLRGRAEHGYVVIKPSADTMQYWSPHLSMSLESVDEVSHATRLRGHYGPAPAVWTMFVFFYAIIALLAVIVAVIGFANMSIDESPYILWLLPVLLALFSTLYTVSYIGQKKSKHQMKEIHTFVVSCLDL